MRRNATSIVVLGAMLALALVPPAAHASRSITLAAESGELGRVRNVTGGVNFKDPFGEEWNVGCALSMTQTFSRSIAKRGGATAGSITAITAESCRGGIVRVLTETLPWPVTYVTFSGTLPVITSMRLQLNGFAWLLSAFHGIDRCLYRGNIQWTTSGNPITSLRWDETVALGLSVDLTVGTCPRTGIFRGTDTISPGIAMTLV